MELALARAGVDPGDAVFIGDTPETDGKAGRAAGVDFVLLHRPGAMTARPAEVQPCQGAPLCSAELRAGGAADPGLCLLAELAAGGGQWHAFALHHDDADAGGGDGRGDHALYPQRDA